MYRVTLSVIDPRHPMAGARAGYRFPVFTLAEARRTYAELVETGACDGGEILRDSGTLAFVRCATHSGPDAAGSCYIVEFTKG